MIENVDLSLVDWSRAQFALTALYHWLFVPLTLGLSFLIAIMETLYVKTGNEEWKKITKFWMKLFGINFAIGVATGIILEFEFGTNWSNYSWFVGDIFGAPLAIEGIMAFFMESTFIAVMFFGWDKVSKKFHLWSSWLTAIGANLSALWILVANGWMQYPAGMAFNPDTARNEMVNFWDVAFSPVAVDKFLHTICSGYVTGAVFVVGVSAWYLLKKRDIQFARKSILVASIFGICSTVFINISGDNSARNVAIHQPMKLAAMEGLYEGREGAGIVAVGMLGGRYEDVENQNLKDFNFKIEIPNLLSYLVYLNKDAFIPGINDLLDGNKEHGFISVEEKMERGRIAINKLKEYKDAKKQGNLELAQSLRDEFTSSDFQNQYYKYFGYGFSSDRNYFVPNIPLSFYSFHIMVGLGFWFMLLFILSLFWVIKGSLINKRWFLKLAVITIPLVYMASMAGWIVAEVGRQPWVIQDLMPNIAAVSQISTSSVMVTFFLFAVIFTVLLIAELKIMFKQINLGPKEGGQH